MNIAFEHLEADPDVGIGCEAAADVELAGHLHFELSELNPKQVGVPDLDFGERLRVA